MLLVSVSFLVIELERVGVAQFAGVNLKIRMVGGKALENFRVTLQRSRRVKDHQAAVGTEVERGGRNGF